MTQSRLPSPADAARLAEWGLVVLEGGLLALLLFTAWGREGQLLPCLALGLAPGTALRLAGRRSWSGHRVGIAAGLMTYLVLGGSLRAAPLWRAAERWPWLLLGGALATLQPLCGAWRWRILLAARGVDVSYGKALRLVLIGFFFNQFVPGATGGDIYRVVGLGRRGGGRALPVASVLLDRVMGLPALLLLVGAASAFNTDLLLARPDFRPYAYALGATGAGCVILLLALIRRAGETNRAVSAKAGDAPEAGDDEAAEKADEETAGLRAAAVRLFRAFAAYRGHGEALLGAIGVGFLAHAGTVLSVVAFGTATGIAGVPVRHYFLLVPMGLTVNSLPLAPGGIGQGEGAFYALFRAASPEGVRNGAAAVAAMLCLRAALLAIGLVGGILFARGTSARTAASPGNGETGREGNANPRIRREEEGGG